MEYLSDGKGNLWISTNKGISKFSIKTESFTNYDSKDGLQGSEFNSRAYYKSVTGEMYLGVTMDLTVSIPQR
jgi:ligand-binding sensor domain-containing protein